MPDDDWLGSADWSDERWDGQLRLARSRQTAGIALQRLDLIALDRAGEPVPRCGHRDDDCICFEHAGHDRAHECVCGARWTYDARGDLVVVHVADRTAHAVT